MSFALCVFNGRSLDVSGEYIVHFAYSNDSFEPHHNDDDDDVHHVHSPTRTLSHIIEAI